MRLSTIVETSINKKKKLVLKRKESSIVIIMNCEKYARQQLSSG
jgi:hypothetical protein